MIEIKQLEPKEFEVLKAIEEGFVPDPHSSIAVIAKDGEDVVGRIMLLGLAHIEGTWVKEDHRKGSIGVRLMSKIESCAKSIGIKKIFAYAPNSDVENYLQRLGYVKENMTVWSKEPLCL